MVTVMSAVSILQSQLLSPAIIANIHIVIGAASEAGLSARAVYLKLEIFTEQLLTLKHFVIRKMKRPHFVHSHHQVYNQRLSQKSAPEQQAALPTALNVEVRQTHHTLAPYAPRLFVPIVISRALLFVILVILKQDQLLTLPLPHCKQHGSN